MPQNKEYIDREWLIENFDIIRQNMIMRQVDKYPAACAFAIKEIKDFPAADVAEVKHAYWNDDGRCSNCDWYMPFDCEGNTFETFYCPHCGAKMDGGRCY